MYAKIFEQIYDGSLCANGQWQALVTFQQLLILADREGNVDMTSSAISRKTTIPIEIIEKGLCELLKPDPESRTPDEEGRRIVLLTERRSWGWRIVNYGKYRAIQRDLDRREYHRSYWHKRKKTDTQQDSTGLNTTQKTQQDSTGLNKLNGQAKAKANAEKKIKKKTSKKENEKVGFVKPSLDEIAAYCRERKNNINPNAFFAYYEANGWRVGKNPMKSWKHSVIYWETNGQGQNTGRGNGGPLSAADRVDQAIAERNRKREEQEKQEKTILGAKILEGDP